MKNVVIIHGTGGSPSGNWFPWLSSELTSLGYVTIIPKFPIGNEQSLENWFKAFDDQVKYFNSETILIGHSLGAVFLLRLLERSNFSISGSVFVAGFVGLLDQEKFDIPNSSFVNFSYDWERIRGNAGKVICYSGEGDPYVPYVQGVELASNLNVQPIFIKNGKHLNAESGFLTFPELLESVINNYNF